MESEKNRATTVSLILLMIIVMILTTPNASADILPVSEIPSSLKIRENLNISLKIVDVSIYTGEEYADGFGNFTLFNYENITKSFTLGFDPGGPLSIATVKIDNISVPIRSGSLSNYSIAIFDSTIAPLSYQTISIIWKTKTKYESHHNGWNPLLVSEKRWLCYYNIIGTLAWKDGIEEVKVRFTSKCSEFDDASSSVTPTKIITDEGGRETIIFEYSNFSQSELMIIIKGKTEVNWKPLIYVCFAIPIVIIIVIVTSVILSGRRKNQS